MVTRKRLCSESCHFLALADIPYKNTQCHRTLGGLSSVCAESEPANSKSNEILEINVLQKFTPHALSEVFLFIEVGKFRNSKNSLLYADLRVSKVNYFDPCHIV